LWGVVAVVFGGIAALVASPALRQSAGGSATRAPAPTAAPVATGAAENREAVQEPAAPRGVEEGAEGAKKSPEAVQAEPNVPAPTAAPSPAPSAAPQSPATAAATVPGAESAELDDAALKALEPGKGYLYVASPLATNVYIYGNLAGTTNQKIATKCGPRFIRLGKDRGVWQGEGLVQIVKCGAVTRVEMGQ
jgi:hypothetical protein